MTREELKEKLRLLTNEATDDTTVSIVDEILGGYNDGNTDEVAQLRSELEAERERFKARFWGGKEKADGAHTDHGAIDHGHVDYVSDKDVSDFFEGV